MLKNLLIFVAFIVVFLIFPKLGMATFDLSMAAGYKTIDFGAMQLDEEKTLSTRGGYEHQFNFTSDKGRVWYFKAQLLRPFTCGAYSIPAENFQWIVEEAKDGQGALAANIATAYPFSTTPVLIYTSNGTDNTGTSVQIKLRYKLIIPQTQASGVYTAQIRFIMVEQL